MCGKRELVVGHSHFAENTVKGNVYFEKLELFAFPKIQDIESEKETAIAFPQDGAPPNCIRTV
jgi:hypothetical protein